MLKQIYSYLTGLRLNIKKKTSIANYTPSEIREIVLHYLNTHNTMSIATSHMNEPWAASVFYASYGFTLYFISNAFRARHSINISYNPKVAITINEDYKLKKFNDWRKIKGIQLEGYACLISETQELTKAVETYIRKYPFTSIYLKTHFKTPKLTLFERLVLRMPFFPKFKASEANRFYKVEPLKVWFVDNERSFEKRLEVPLC